MTRFQKKYSKALDKYNNGYIDKAIQLCEKNISNNINDSASINLKGLLMYIKGDINTARNLWKINASMNKDEVSKKYLETSYDDIYRLALYKKAVLFFKKLRINEAVSLFEECGKSDFNLINVNNYLALCYIKMAEYSKSIYALDKIFKIDINNRVAKKTKKMLQNIRVVKKSSFIKKIIIVITVIIAIGTIIFFIYSHIVAKSVHIKINPLYSVQEKKYNKSKSITHTSIHKNIKRNVLPYGKIKKYIVNKNYNQLYDLLQKYKNDNLVSTNNKILLIRARKLLSSEGVNYFYKIACNYLASKDYNKSKEYFIKAFQYGSNNSIYPDIIYMLGYNFESVDDVENAIKYYEKYNKNYSNGSYEETVLYRLSCIYKDLDKSKARIYASKLSNKYPSSIYNNSIIYSLISN